MCNSVQNTDITVTGLSRGAVYRVLKLLRNVSITMDRVEYDNPKYNYTLLDAEAITYFAGE